MNLKSQQQLEYTLVELGIVAPVLLQYPASQGGRFIVEENAAIFDAR